MGLSTFLSDMLVSAVSISVLLMLWIQVRKGRQEQVKRQRIF